MPKPLDFSEALERLGSTPHCDGLVLHAPSTCQFCDTHPDWQALRVVWGINFTGEEDPKKHPCPSTAVRPVDRVHAWPGNRPKAPDAPGRSVYERLRDKLDSDE